MNLILWLLKFLKATGQEQLTMHGCSVGPDKGEGGKYLILPPLYEGEMPEGYFVAKSPTYNNLLILRGFLAG